METLGDLEISATCRLPHFFAVRAVDRVPIRHALVADQAALAAAPVPEALFDLHPGPLSDVHVALGDHVEQTAMFRMRILLPTIVVKRDLSRKPGGQAPAARDTWRTGEILVEPQARESKLTAEPAREREPVGAAVQPIG